MFNTKNSVFEGVKVSLIIALVLITVNSFSQFQIIYTAPQYRNILAIKGFQNIHNNDVSFYLHLSGDSLTAQSPYWIRYYKNQNIWNDQPHFGFLVGSRCFNGTGGFSFSHLGDFIKGKRDTNLLIGRWEWVTCINPESGVDSRITYNSGLNFIQPIMPQGTLYSFDFDPLSDSIIYGVGAAYLQAGKFWKTTNKGNNWSSLILNGGNTSIYSIKVNPLNRNVIYCSADNSFYRSNNVGANFVLISTLRANGLTVNPSDTSIIVNNFTGVYKSTNGGYNFTNTLNVNCKAILIHPDNHNIIYAGTINGIYRSTNGGDNWVLYFASFSGSQSVNGMVKYKNDLDTIYASNNKFVYKIWASSVGISLISNEIPTEFKLHQNYPNPFNPKTNIKFSVPKGTKSTLIIYDIIGSEVARYLDAYIDAGTYNAEIDATGWTSGIYFYTLRTSEFTQTKKMILTK